MMKTKLYAGLGMTAALVLGVCVLAPATPAPAMSTADQPAAVLVWPSIKVASGIDTRINLVNHSDESKIAHCIYIESPNCQPVDFWIYLTPEQPVSWLVSDGMDGPIDSSPFDWWCFTPEGAKKSQCFPWNTSCPLGGTCAPAPNNAGTNVPGRGTSFTGALKCVQFHTDPQGGGPIPDTENSLSGSATIINGSPDVERYNAIGIKATGTATDPFDGSIVLGGASYDSCPTSLILNHIFDFSTNPLEIVPGGDPTLNRTMFTDLTLIPCADNFQTTGGKSVTTQFLIFNEFEQRFSTSTQFRCLLEKELSQIDSPGSPDRSVWSAYVAGTLAGQTRIRGVGDTDRSLLAVARLKNTVTNGSTANSGTHAADYTVHQQGDGKQDTMVLH